MSAQPSESEIHPTESLKIWQTVPVESSTIYGVENELLVLHKMLSGDGFKAIAITGVRGIGKSALCRAFLQNPDVKSKFLPRIWVSMSKPFTEHENPKIALLKRILFCLGVDNDFPGGQTIPGLLYAIRLQLRSKRFLIVLDDAQEQGNKKQGNQEQGNQEQGSQEEGNQEQGDNWYWDLKSKSEEIGEQLRDGFRGGKGGAVIVTSRSEKEAKAMVGEGNLRRLVLHKDPEEFWKIFQHEIEKEGDSSHIPSSSSSNLKELKLELINKCGGLPLAAKMMGQIKLHEIKDQS